MRRFRAQLVVLIASVAIVPSAAQDVARFVNLGFSDDSRVFMFAQYGVTRETATPYAEIYTVDVPDNTFINSGLASSEFDTPVGPGQDGLGALFTLLPQVRAVVSQYDVHHLRQGRLIYVFINGSEVRSRIEFRDFETDNTYAIELIQEARGSGASGSAAFSLNVRVNSPSGSVSSVQVGRPDLFRHGVNEYAISQVIVSPDGRSLVIVMQRNTEAETGVRQRYMVETVRLF